MGSQPHRQDVRQRDGRVRHPGQTGLRGLLALGALALIGATPAPPKAFDQETAWAHLNKQVAFGTRNPGGPGHIPCRDYLLKELKATTDAAEIRPFVHRWSVTGEAVKMYNVVGTVNWEKAETRVLLMAHWDTRPTADQEPREEDRSMPIAGANDGASGVAVLLELARALHDDPIPGLGVQLLLVDGEDLGPGLDEMFLGARAYARDLPAKRPDYGILLDMVGDKDLEIPMEPFSKDAAPRLMSALYAHAEKVGLGRTFPRRMGGQIYDDHLSLIQAGVPTIDLIDFTYPHWHTLADTPDKCSAASLGKVGLLMETWLRANPTFRKPK